MGQQVTKAQKLLSVAAWLVVVAFPIQAWADGKALFDTRCVTCHVLPDPDNLTADMWVPVMERMSPMANLNASEKTGVLGYLQANSGTLENILVREQEHFKRQCSTCHTTAEKVPLTDKTGAQFEEYMIEHVEDKTDNDMDEKIAREIAQYLCIKSR